MILMPCISCLYVDRGRPFHLFNVKWSTERKQWCLCWKAEQSLWESKLFGSVWYARKSKVLENSAHKRWVVDLPINFAYSATCSAEIWMEAIGRNLWADRMPSRSYVADYSTKNDPNVFPRYFKYDMINILFGGSNMIFGNISRSSSELADVEMSQSSKPFWRCDARCSRDKHIWCGLLRKTEKDIWEGFGVMIYS